MKIIRKMTRLIVPLFTLIPISVVSLSQRDKLEQNTLVSVNASKNTSTVEKIIATDEPVVKIKTKAEQSVKFGETINETIQLFTLEVKYQDTAVVFERIPIEFDISMRMKTTFPIDGKEYPLSNFSDIDGFKISSTTNKKFDDKGIDVTKEFKDYYTLNNSKISLYTIDGRIFWKNPRLFPSYDTRSLFVDDIRPSIRVNISTLSVKDSKPSSSGEPSVSDQNQAYAGVIRNYSDHYNLSNKSISSLNKIYFKASALTSPLSQFTIIDPKQYLVSSTSGCSGPETQVYITGGGRPITECRSPYRIETTYYYKSFRYEITKNPIVNFTLNVLLSDNSKAISQYSQLNDLGYDKLLEIDNKKTVKSLTTQEVKLTANREYLNLIASLSAVTSSLERIDRNSVLNYGQKSVLRSLVLSGKVIDYSEEHDVIFYREEGEEDGVPFKIITTIQNGKNKPLQTFSIYEQEYKKENTLQYWLSRPQLLDLPISGFEFNWSWIENIKTYPELLNRTWTINDSKKYFSSLNAKYKNNKLVHGALLEMDLFYGNNSEVRDEYKTDLVSEMLGLSPILTSKGIGHQFATKENLKVEYNRKRAELNNIKVNSKNTLVSFASGNSKIKKYSSSVTVNKPLEISEIITPKEIKSSIKKYFGTFATNKINNKWIDSSFTDFLKVNDRNLDEVSSIREFSKQEIVKKIEVQYSAASDTITAKIGFDLNDAIENNLSYTWKMGDRNAEVEVIKSRVSSAPEIKMIEFKDQTLEEAVIRTNLSQIEFENIYSFKEDSNHFVFTSNSEANSLPKEIRILKNYKSASLDNKTVGTTEIPTNNYMWVLYAFLGIISLLITSIVVTRRLKMNKIKRENLAKLSEMDDKEEN
jgi:hypothetical protein